MIVIIKCSLSRALPINIMEITGASTSCVTRQGLYIRCLHQVCHANNELRCSCPFVSINREEIISGRPKDLSTVEMTKVSTARGCNVTSCSSLASNLWHLPSLVFPSLLSLSFFSPRSASAVHLIGNFVNRQSTVSKR